MSGIFKTKDALSIQQSTRIDSHWTFFKRQLQIQHALFNKKLIVCELGAGTGDLAQLAQSMEGIKKYICIEGSYLVGTIKQRKMSNVEIIKEDIETATIKQADIFLAKYLFHHIKNKKRLLRRIYTALPKNGALCIIDKFPRWGIISLILEKIWNAIGIKRQLGNHYYLSHKKFIEQSFTAGFDIEYESIKKPKKIKNFFITKGFYVLRKNQQYKILHYPPLTE
jgi:ubiquinone/menaquinone biosynthesis C-methylase UbiE